MTKKTTKASKKVEVKKKSESLYVYKLGSNVFKSGDEVTTSIPIATNWMKDGKVVWKKSLPVTMLESTQDKYTYKFK